jgi:predicted Zn-dependent protease
LDTEARLGASILSLAAAQELSAHNQSWSSREGKSAIGVHRGTGLDRLTMNAPTRLSRSLIGTLSIIGLCAGFCACAGTSASVERDRATARQAAERGEWIRAGEHWLRVHQYSGGKDESAAEGVATALHRQGHQQGALNFLRPLLDRHPQRARLWRLDGSIRLASGQSELARTSWETAIELDPSRAAWAVDLGELQFQLGDPCAALSSFGQALISPDAGGHVWIMLARSSADCGHGLGALRAYRSAFMIREGEFGELMAAVELGFEELEFADLDSKERSGWLIEQLLDWSQRAANMRPQSTRAHLFAGRIAHIAGRPDIAAERFERAAELDPGSYPALIALIEVRIEEGDLEGAERISQHALGLDPNDAERAAIESALQSAGGQ